MSSHKERRAFKRKLKYGEGLEAEIRIAQEALRNEKHLWKTIPKRKAK